MASEVFYSELVDAFSLDISNEKADKNYEVAGSVVNEPSDEISCLKYRHLMLNDKVHFALQETIHEVGLNFQLADFQLVSLHALGNKMNVILILPTGSGKMLGKIAVYIVKMVVFLLSMK